MNKEMQKGILPENKAEAPYAPGVKSIEECDFPLVEREADKYKVLVLPPDIWRFFDKEGYGAVRINSAELAAKLPSYGGRTTATYSLPPHQDHLPTDPRRFLALSKEDAPPRDSVTYIVRPEVVQKALPKILDYFHARRDIIRASFVYDPASQATEEELLGCFLPGGLDRLAEIKSARIKNQDTKLFMYAGILTYLLPGLHSEAVVQEFLNENKGAVAIENWSRPGVFIIDNAKVFHGRRGKNGDSLKRNWLVLE